MKFGYEQPLMIAKPAEPVSIISIKHGTTEVSLSDGRIVRLSIHVQGVKPDVATVDVSYSVVTEVMIAPSAPILDQHESIQ